MVRINRYELLKKEMISFIETFVNASYEERLNIINGYSSMTSVQTTALLQCKKFMSAEEKKGI